MRKTSFLETQTAIQALEYTLDNNGFESAQQKKTAQLLVKRLRSTDTVSGRHRELIPLLKKGATIQQMVKASKTSRRTVFRYLNHFEEAGINITLVENVYTIK